MSINQKTITFLFVAHVFFILFIGIFFDYDVEAGPEEYISENNTSKSFSKSFKINSQTVSKLDHYYAMFQDVQVMMLVGFGFLMTFLKKHGFNSIGFNLLLTCFVIEWSLLINGCFGLIGVDSSSSSVIWKMKIDIESLLEADFAVATVLISFGAVLGVASPLQLLIMAFIEVIAYNVNILIGVEVFGAIDVGGSIFIHAFGAYYGLAVARMLYKKIQISHENESSNTYSDLMAMIGTLYLWLYWPSFNAGPATGHERHRAVVNTVLSLSASTVVTFAFSAFFNKGLFRMTHIQNASLAGAVAMGASADLIVRPFGALLIGSAAGIVSTFGYHYLQKKLENNFKLHDTCGVHNLHGMPGILGALNSVIAVAVANQDVYKKSYKNLFEPKHIPAFRIDTGLVGAQFIALVVALVLAIFTGTLTGFLLKLPYFDNLDKKHELFNDEIFWRIEENGSFHETRSSNTGRPLDPRKSVNEVQF